jgi:hypothetical protein
MDEERYMGCDTHLFSFFILDLGFHSDLSGPSCATFSDSTPYTPIPIHGVLDVVLEKEIDENPSPL